MSVQYVPGFFSVISKPYKLLTLCTVLRQLPNIAQLTEGILMQNRAATVSVP